MSKIQIINPGSDTPEQLNHEGLYEALNKLAVGGVREAVEAAREAQSRIQSLKEALVGIQLTAEDFYIDNAPDGSDKLSPQAQRLKLEYHELVSELADLTGLVEAQYGIINVVKSRMALIARLSEDLPK